LKYLQAILLLMILVGCGGRSTPLPEPTAVETTILTLTPRPFPETATNSAPTSSPAIPTSTTIPSRTPTTEIKPIEMGEIPVCSGKGMLVRSSDEIGIKGTLVFHIDLDGPLAAVHWPGQTETMIAERVHEALGFSPDEKWFAYVPANTNASGESAMARFSVVLIGNDGETIETPVDTQKVADNFSSSFQIQVIGHHHWVTNDLLFITLLAWESSTELVTFIDRFSTLLDPFTGTWRMDLLETLSDLVQSEQFDISPDLQRALYFKLPMSMYIQTNESLTLKSMPDQNILWEDPDYWDYGSYHFPSEIRWNPDGSKAVVSGLRASTQERVIYLISRNGIVVKIIGTSNEPADHFYPLLFRWSPNARYLAMFNLLSWEIFIFDTVTNQYLLRCPVLDNEYVPYNFVWSPGNNAILYGTWKEKMRLLDIASGKTYELNQRGIPAGWSEQFMFMENP
jgi:hypothetical protein